MVLLLLPYPVFQGAFGRRSDKDVAGKTFCGVYQGESDQRDGQWNGGAGFRAGNAGSDFPGPRRSGLRQGIDVLPMCPNHVRCRVQGIAFGGRVLPSPSGRDSRDSTSRVRQAETPRTASSGGVGALFGRRTASLCQGNGGTDAAVAVALSRAGVGWEPSGRHRPSHFRVASFPRRCPAWTSVGVLRSSVRPDDRCDSLRRRLRPRTVVAGSSVELHLGPRLHLGGSQLLHHRVFVWDSSSSGLFRDSAARLDALLGIAGKTPPGGTGWPRAGNLRTSDSS